jgi:hypothetical protein
LLLDAFKFLSAEEDDDGDNSRLFAEDDDDDDDSTDVDAFSEDGDDDDDCEDECSLFDDDEPSVVAGLVPRAADAPVKTSSVRMYDNSGFDGFEDEEALELRSAESTLDDRVDPAQEAEEVLHDCFSMLTTTSPNCEYTAHRTVLV